MFKLLVLLFIIKLYIHSNVFKATIMLLIQDIHWSQGIKNAFEEYFSIHIKFNNLSSETEMC